LSPARRASEGGIAAGPRAQDLPAGLPLEEGDSPYFLGPAVVDRSGGLIVYELSDGRARGILPPMCPAISLINSEWSMTRTPVVSVRRMLCSPGRFACGAFPPYISLDSFSLCTVGWVAAHRESPAPAQRFIQETYNRKTIQPGQPTIRADRGSSTTYNLVARLLAELEVGRPPSYRRVLDNNP